ncbi:MAG TPA: hypothetical protein PLP29_07025 [Candidatus Ozemobacteraceae bacterium]|nr:hypothetical protein [Candidatus Ozemobacteraceae bacterium]
MSLSSMWNDQPDQLADKQIQQIISFAGEGKLADDSATSKEFRDFLQLVTSDFLNKYVNEPIPEI